MANYVEFESDPQVPPPYVFPGVTVRSFRFEADLLKLQALCDKFLNIGSILDRGFEYRAILPFVDLDFLIYPNMLYGLPPYSQWGYATQRELYFKFFIIKFILVDDWFLLPAPEIGAFFPYIFVDNFWSAAAGREVIGFPKLLAQFEYGSSPNTPYPIKATSLAIETYAPSSELRPLPVLEVRADAAPGAIASASNWALSPALIDFLDPLLQATLSFEEAINPGLLRTVHLKQFRDPASATNACYQAVVEAQFEMSNIQLLELPPAEVVLHPHATLHIADNLGLVGTSPLKPVSQFAAQCDLAYQNVETIFVSSD